MAAGPFTEEACASPLKFGSQASVSVWPLQAHSRLAALLRELKHHSREVDVLEELQVLVKGDKIEEAAVARRLREARTAANSGTHNKAPAVDHYKVLGVERSVSAEDVSHLLTHQWPQLSYILCGSTHWEV